jgi:hypothetical protein
MRFCCHILPSRIYFKQKIVQDCTNYKTNYKLKDDEAFVTASIIEVKFL